MKEKSFYAVSAMIEDVMHNSSGPFVCLLRMGDYTSMMCDEIHLSEVLVTLVTHIWTSLRRHENGPSASARRFSPQLSDVWKRKKPVSATRMQRI